jgi:Zn-dependent peptidase ImmA (M78 family)
MPQAQTMTETLPVNNNILKWARETIGLSTDQVASRMKKPVERMTDWENGESAPTYPMLEKLAYEVYKRPIAVFFFPSIPQEENPRAEFRTLPHEVIDTMPTAIIKMYRKAKNYQLNLEDFYENKKPSQQSLIEQFKFNVSTDIPSFSKNIRNVLGVDSTKQKSWDKIDTAIEQWRLALNKYGIFIFKDAFHDNAYSGLCLYDENYPVILLNNSMSKTRQVFTVFHELAHLLFNSGGIDVLSETFSERLTGDYYRIEQKCNQFAAEFLFPLSEFQAEGLPFTEKNVSDLATLFKVSREVVLRKYLETKQIDSATYVRFTEKWLDEFLSQRGNKAEESGGNYYHNKKSYLGEKYIDLAFGKYYQGKITIETLADYLGMNVQAVPVFENYVLG